MDTIAWLDEEILTDGSTVYNVKISGNLDDEITLSMVDKESAEELLTLIDKKCIDCIVKIG